MKNLVFNLRTAKAQAEGCAKVTKSSRMAKVLTTLTLLLTLGVGQMWGYNNVYLSGEMNSWGTYDYGTSGNGTYYIYTQKNQTFKFKVSSYWRGAYGSSTYSITISDNYTVCDCDGQNFKYTGNTGIVAFSFSQTTSGGSEWKPNISLARPTIYIRHNWNNTGWSNQSMTDNNDGTYKYDGIYSGSKATNIGPCSSCTSGSATFKYITSATLVGSPETGDKCRFVYNSNGYKGEGSESSNTGTLTITKLCKITYNGNGKTSGTVPSAQSDNLYNTSVTLSSNNLSKTGYTHTGWNTEADGNGTHYNKGASITVTDANLTLYAEWTPTTTTITLSKNAQGGSTVTGAASVTATYDAALPLFTALSSTKDYALTGYWTSASGGIKIINANGTLVPNVTISTTPYTGADGIWKYTGSTLTLHAQWSLDRTLTYDGNGATSGSVPAAATSYPNGTSVTVLGNTGSFVKTGYTFTGWNTAADGNGTAKVAGNSITMDANYTLFAQWSENKSSVSIAASPSGAGTFSPASPVLAGVDTKPNVTATAVPGYKFSSWAITGGATISSTSTNPTTVTGKGASEAATLTANFVRTYAFIEGRFHVTNASRNGTWTNTFGDGNWDDSSTRIPFAYDETNHQFYLRTYATPKELSTQISSLPPYFFIKTSTASGSLTNVKTYRPYASGTNQELTTAGDSYKKAIGEYNNSHSFWFNSTDESGYVKLYFNESKIWYWLEQTLEYNGNGSDGGSAPASKSYYDKGTSVQAKANTYTRTGYTFTGWNTEANGKGTAVAANGWHTLDANTTLYAQWSENNYTVTVQAGEHGSVASGSVTGHKDTKVTLPTATADPGYYFTGWTRVSGSTVTWTNQSSATAAKVNGLTSGVTVQANFAPLWSLAGGLDGGSNWPLDAAHKFTSYSTNASSHQEGHLSFDLAANSSYWIQLYNNQSSAYYGLASGSSPRDVYYSSPSTGWDITGATGNISLYVHTAAAGTYDFYWDIVANKLYVHYPTSLFITSGQKTEGQDDNAGGSFTALDNGSRDVTGGKFVANGASVTFTASPNTGYTFDGWYSNAACTTPYTAGTNVSFSGEGNTTMVISSIAEVKTVYAKFVPKTYPITLTRTGTGYGSGGDASVTATYNQTMPVATMPTAAQGYAFMGFYTATGGGGSKMINADGTWANVSGYISGGKWIRDGGATLYAYYKKAEITAITLNNTMFDPVAAGGTGFVIANPTIEPTPVLPVKICWELLYDNDNPVPSGHAPEAYTESGTKPDQVRFSIAGLAAGGYKIKATLRTGDDCSGGTLLSEREVSFTIASGYTVTIQYKDSEGNTIAPSTTSPGKATDWTSISAPTIVGYNFSTWVPGDGITLESSATTNSNRFKATFNGTLTARYTKKRVIYFNNTLGWSNVYVYFYSSNKYWADNYGTGAYAGKYFDGYKPYSDQRHGHMTQIEGTNIWYFDYTAAGYDTYENIAFANMDKSNSGTDNTSNNDLGFFSNTPSDPIQVVRRGDHNASLPMFVPLAGQPKTKLNNNKAEYSNQGYWMNYPENTGYALRLFNSSGVEIDSIPFEFTPDKTMPMSVEYILDGSKTYQFKLYRTDGKWFGNNGTMKAGASGDISETSWEFKEKDGETTRNNCQIKTNAAGTYTFTLDFGNKDGYNYLIGVHYPAAANDFQILYNDNAEWSLGSTHDENWVHPSRIIRARENGVDTISFFVAKDNTPILKARKVSSINASGAITWGSLNISGAAKQDLTVDSSAVYNFKVTQGAAGVINSIQYIGAYTGNYYIRSSALSNKWGNYVDNLDHRMTYSSFSESNANSFGEKYSHYKAKWCPRNTNIAFCIANDYSPCITDTLKQDVGNPYNNTDTEGTLKNDGDAGHSGNNAYLDRYSANVRFMWDRKTNKISRAYISAATSGLAQFLVLRAGQELHNENNVAISSSPANSVLLSDNENWIYEARLMIKPGTRFKLYACYAKSPVDPASAQYFRGAYDSDNFTSDDNSVILIGGSSEDYQLARIVYDFKTNRLIAAWMPSGEVSGTNEINADVMVIRDHQESARCITFADASANLSKVKTVYGVMRFNRWILNNRQHPEDQNKDHARPDHIAEDLRDHHAPLPVGQQKSTYERRLYFISFPFDVLVGDIFGFGTYGQYWVIQYYDGLNRAKKGYWMDSKPNWKYVSPAEVAQGYKLEKNQGYILELNLKAMAADNTTFWSNGISTIELYFPSTVNQETLKQTNCTIPALSDEYECKINRDAGEGDRRVKDSYWRCIGVPSYNLYNSTLKDGSGNTITWKTDYTWHNDEREFPFIYMWNKTDNTLTPQATSTFTFQPMHAYLTQIKSAIVWTAVSAKPSSIVARRARKEATKEYNWRIELKQDTTFLDQTYVRMTDLEQVTDNFDFGQDLIKELNSRSNIYTFIGYEKVAANSMTLHTDQTTVIPVGANITTEGEYTFALPDGADGIGVTLIDEETGVRTSLSAGMDYTVYLEKGTHDNRFWLEISPVQQTPTDIEAVSGQPSEVRKVLIDGILYIVKDGKLFDARGARLR